MTCHIYVNELTKGAWFAIHCMLASGTESIHVHVKGAAPFVARRKVAA